MDAPQYIQGNYSVAERDRIFAKADSYPDASGGLTYQVPTLMPNGSIAWRQQSSGGGDGTANANLAVVEPTTTATQAYAVGDLLVYGGQLYEVTAAISAGGTITPGTNVTPTTMGAYVQEQATGGGVTSFNGRTGAVVPAAGDYTAALVGADPAGSAAAAAAARQAQIVYRQITLVAANWSNNAQTVTVPGVSATETEQLIQPVPASPSSRAEYESCQVKATAQAANSLTFECGAVPTNDLTVYVCLTEVEAAT